MGTVCYGVYWGGGVEGELKSTLPAYCADQELCRCFLG